MQGFYTEHVMVLCYKVEEYITNLKAITEKQKIVANKQSRKVITNKPTYYKIE